MNIKKTVEGIVILVFAALILADGVLGVMDIADTPLLTLPVFKLLVGFLALVLAGAYIEESRNLQQITRQPASLFFILSALVHSRLAPISEEETHDNYRVNHPHQRKDDQNKGIKRTQVNNCTCFDC